jgi:hypothetical protein
MNVIRPQRKGYHLHTPERYHIQIDKDNLHINDINTSVSKALQVKNQVAQNMPPRYQHRQLHGNPYHE